jgi:hypothetical protein
MWPRCPAFRPKRFLALNDEPHVSARVRQLVKDAAAKLTITQSDRAEPDRAAQLPDRADL